MRVPLEWLKQWVPVGAGTKEIGHALTMAGLEIEGLDGEGDAVVFEVNVTPNRPDCLSVMGIARECAALFGLPLTPPSIVLPEAVSAVDARVDILAPDLCHRYAARVIRGVRIAPSPAWMSSRLEAVGIRPINNVVDVTNYVLAEMGHPLHAFDLNRLKGRHILVDRATEGETFTTLDGQERRLSSSMLTIRDDAGPVALAGIMGGQNSEVAHDTVDVLLESAWFLPSSIRRTSRGVGLSSESSYRFERGADIEGLIAALDRAAALMLDVAGGQLAGGRIDIYPVSYVPPRISVDRTRIRRLLGYELSAREVDTILERLGFVIETAGNVLRVTPPPFRRDVEREIDVVEEIARLVGYERIPSRLPKGEPPPPRIDRRYKQIAQVKESFRRSGFSEVVNFSFMNPEHLGVLGVPEGDVRHRTVHLLNPLRHEDRVLRSSLVPSLLQNVAWNLNRGMDGIRLFEVSKVFSCKEGAILADEPVQVCAVLTRPARALLYPSAVPGFFELKGAVDSLIQELRLDALVEYHNSDETHYLVPGQSADMFVGQSHGGRFGTVRDHVLEAFGISNEVWIAELDLDVLLKSVPPRPAFKPLPKFPFVERDMALLAWERTSVSDILQAIRSFGHEWIVSTDIFDLYKGKGIPEGRKSMAFSIRYQSTDRTLTLQEVENVHRLLVSYLEKHLGVLLRGK